MFFTIHLAPNIIIGPTIASGVLLNPNILRYNIPDIYRDECRILPPALSI